MKKLIVLFLIMASITSFAQQALFGGQDIKSPEIKTDNSVIFRVMAPNAKKVKLSGDWMPAEGWTPGSVTMTKDEKGLWSFTTEVLQPELYSYSFISETMVLNDTCEVKNDPDREARKLL